MAQRRPRTIKNENPVISPSFTMISLGDLMRAPLPEDTRRRYFDSDHCFVVPEDCAATTKEHALVWAARALDSRDRTIAKLRERLGDPREWTKQLVEFVSELYGFVGDASVAAYGREPPRYRIRPALDEALRDRFPLDDLMLYAHINGERVSRTMGHCFTDLRRARLVCWMAGVCKALESVAPSGVLLIEKLENVVFPELKSLRSAEHLPPIELIMEVKRLHQKAEIYAALGDLSGRQIAGITAFLLNRLGEQRASVVAPLEVYVARERNATSEAGGVFRGLSIPAVMTRDDTMADQFLTLCREIEQLGDIATRERAGAALLATGLLVGRGTKRPCADSYERALAECQDKAPDEPEPFQNASLNREVPALRFHRWVRRGLDALGHQSDDFAAALLRRGKRRRTPKK